MLELYTDKCSILSDAKRRKTDFKYAPANLTLDEYYYSEWYNDKSVDKKGSDDLRPLEGSEEEVKEEKGLKILTQKKLLTRLSILLAQIKAGNNSYKLKNKIRKILYLFRQHDNITEKIYNKLIKSL